MNPQLFTAFLLITLVLVLAPGPIVTLVVSTGATRGLRPALATVVGTTLGNALLLTAIALGLSWALLHALILFEIMRWVGAAYLIYLGVQAWRGAAKASDPLPVHDRVHFARGLVVALTNPKTTVFFTAFLPQFVDPSLSAGRQLAIMCVASTLMAATTDTAWAVAAGLGRAWFMHPARARLLARLSGCALIGGGIWLSLTRRPA
ncbi:MAG: LysE family translocator [Bradyrhizobium sp.]|nr:MAG: LysE family translocator [Bradyrhizobium sp.]